MSRNQFKECKKFQIDDVVEYVATDPMYAYLNGSVVSITTGVVNRLEELYRRRQPPMYAYGVAWVVSMGDWGTTASNWLFDEDRLKLVHRSRVRRLNGGDQ
jgi:hypothetical protein